MNELYKYGLDWIRIGNLLHTTPTLYHLSYFGSYEIPFKCYRWTSRLVLGLDDFKT